MQPRCVRLALPLCLLLSLFVCLRAVGVSAFLHLCLFCVASLVDFRGCVHLFGPLSLFFVLFVSPAWLHSLLFCFRLSAFVACLAGLVTVFASLAPFCLLLLPAFCLVAFPLSLLISRPTGFLAVASLFFAGSEDFASLKKRYRHVV